MNSSIEIESVSQRFIKKMISSQEGKKREKRKSRQVNTSKIKPSLSSDD